MTREERARQRAEDYVRDRGWRHEPLAWEEVAALLEATDRDSGEWLHWGDVAARIAGVTMSKTARRALAAAFDFDESEVQPRTTVA